MRSIEVCESGAWSLGTWGRTDGENPTVRPFRCRSWRHAGECRRECGACDFARVSEAISKHRYWTYLVLTYRRDKDIATLFREGKDHWSILRKRLVRRFQKILYIQTWEIHKDEFPHINVCVSNRKLFEAAEKEKNQEEPRFLIPEAEASGFGWKCYASPIRGRDAMAGYLTKTALELTGSHNKQNDQTPVNAPPHFRRIRASRGLLPPRKRNDLITGQLFFCPLEYVDDSLNRVGTFPRGGDASKPDESIGRDANESPGGTTEQEIAPGLEREATIGGTV